MIDFVATTMGDDRHNSAAGNGDEIDQKSELLNTGTSHPLKKTKVANYDIANARNQNPPERASLQRDQLVENPNKHSKADKFDKSQNGSSLPRNETTKNNAKNQKNNARYADIQLSKSLSWVLRHSAPSLGLSLTSDGYVPVNDMLRLNHPRFRKNSRGELKYTVDDVKRVVENNDKQRFRLEYKDFVDLSMKRLYSESGNAESNEDPEAVATECDANEEKDIKILCIRANQGHSIKKHIQSDRLLTPLSNDQLSDPKMTIIHGTSMKAWRDHIRIEGLKRMKRNHIHFASGLPACRIYAGGEGGEKRNMAAPKSGMRTNSEVYIYINGRNCSKCGIPFFRSDNGVILTEGIGKEGFLPLKYFEKVVDASSGQVLWEGSDV
mmetsp:Transcript_14045/g.30166  ORF Transcript_14045/g.30166 Transcript_14045/m.30166 type:complete len:381 (-) Transcript_14045:34-1176(-)